MLDKTEYIKNKIRQLSQPKDILPVLLNSYKGQECYIVSCGPSLKEHDPDVLREKLKDKLVISVKQAYDVLPTQTDFHIFNYIHFKEFNYSKPAPIVVELTRFGKVLSKSTDLAAPINVRTAGLYQHSVAVNKRFDVYTFDKQLQRPFGPGILYELATPLAVHLGVSGITTIGWDCTAPTQHFYGDKRVNPDRLKVLQREMEVVVGAMPAFAKWLEQKGSPLKIISSINPAPASIPRLKLEEI